MRVLYIQSDFELGVVKKLSKIFLRRGLKINQAPSKRFILDSNIWKIIFFCIISPVSTNLGIYFT